MEKNYEKEVRIALIERDWTVKKLVEEINAKAGMKIDTSFLNKVLHGKCGSVKTVEAIAEILGVAVPEGYGRGGFKA